MTSLNWQTVFQDRESDGSYKFAQQTNIDCSIFVDLTKYERVYPCVSELVQNINLLYKLESHLSLHIIDVHLLVPDNGVFKNFKEKNPISFPNTFKMSNAQLSNEIIKTKRT